MAIKFVLFSGNCTSGDRTSGGPPVNCSYLYKRNNIFLVSTLKRNDRLLFLEKDEKVVNVYLIFIQITKKSFIHMKNPS